ncbi:hypothetical protein BESB_022990 [Besnoitia besnoiti]|uniref:UBC core domain-containing protein n=1 Tax=Besnoitia besnoiti TaxID=94643 RepID=A0A2A9M832_BESBE|nr:hypothetical protein BESB_022990 [Besnoitia besnoiti]PFH31807.1 hypothetical protein BESB_022990 [Besnoitia besnoiti]
MSTAVAPASASPLSGGAAGRLMREYRAIQRDQIPFILVKPDENDILTWHYVLHDLPEDTPYRGGLYHGKLVFPSSYPYAPPAIYMMTPNGRFVPNRRLCLSISDFHPESWNPAWRVETILTGLLSFMLDSEEPVAYGTMGCLPSERRRLALSSFAANKRNPAFLRLFPELLADRNFDPALGYSLHGHANTDDTDKAGSPFGSASVTSSPSTSFASPSSVHISHAAIPSSAPPRASLPSPSSAESLLAPPSPHPPLPSRPLLALPSSSPSSYFAPPSGSPASDVSTSPTCLSSPDAGAETPAGGGGGPLATPGSRLPLAVGSDCISTSVSATGFDSKHMPPVLGGVRLETCRRSETERLASPRRGVEGEDACREVTGSAELAEDLHGQGQPWQVRKQKNSLSPCRRPRDEFSIPLPTSRHWPCGNLAEDCGFAPSPSKRRLQLSALLCGRRPEGRRAPWESAGAAGGRAPPRGGGSGTDLPHTSLSSSDFLSSLGGTVGADIGAGCYRCTQPREAFSQAKPPAGATPARAAVPGGEWPPAAGVSRREVSSNLIDDRGVWSGRAHESGFLEALARAPFAQTSRDACSSSRSGVGSGGGGKAGAARSLFALGADPRLPSQRLACASQGEFRRYPRDTDFAASGAEAGESRGSVAAWPLGNQTGVITAGGVSAPALRGDARLVNSMIGDARLACISAECLATHAQRREGRPGAEDTVQNRLFPRTHSQTGNGYVSRSDSQLARGPIIPPPSSNTQPSALSSRVAAVHPSVPAFPQSAVQLLSSVAVSSAGGALPSSVSVYPRAPVDATSSPDPVRFFSNFLSGSSFAFLCGDGRPSGKPEGGEDVCVASANATQESAFEIGGTVEPRCSGSGGDSAMSRQRLWVDPEEAMRPSSPCEAGANVDDDVVILGTTPRRGGLPTRSVEEGSFEGRSLRDILAAPGASQVIRPATENVGVSSLSSSYHGSYPVPPHPEVAAGSGLPSCEAPASASTSLTAASVSASLAADSASAPSAFFSAGSWSHGAPSVSLAASSCCSPFSLSRASLFLASSAAHGCPNASAERDVSAGDASERLAVLSLLRSFHVTQAAAWRSACLSGLLDSAALSAATIRIRHSAALPCDGSGGDGDPHPVPQDGDEDEEEKRAAGEGDGDSGEQHEEDEQGEQDDEGGEDSEGCQGGNQGESDRVALGERVEVCLSRGSKRSAAGADDVRTEPSIGTKRPRVAPVSVPPRQPPGAEAASHSDRQDGERDCD